MTKLKLTEELEKREDNSEQIAAGIITGKIAMGDIFEGVDSKIARVKFRSAKILRYLSENKPEMLYPYFNFFVRLMETDNKILKWNAMNIIANLSSIDSNLLFEEIFDKFYNMLNEGNLITSSHIVEKSANIINAKPDLKGPIIKLLLQVETIPLPTEECRSIICGKTIEVLSSSYDQIANKKRVFDFVSKQLRSQRSATRKKPNRS